MSGDIAGADRSPAAPSHPPSTVSLVSFAPCVSPSPRRLSSCFTERGRPVLSARRQLAWVSLQGRLVGGQEATSAKAIGGGLGRDETVAWELFSPLHRVLIVAVMAVSTAESKRSKKISQLQRSVDLRDQVLLGMQQKLDDLCLQMSSTVDWPMKSNNQMYPENDEPSCRELPKLNPESGITPLFKNALDKQKEECVIESSKYEMFKSTHVNNAEQEERRMSDLSDFCASVTSSVDIQLSTLAAEQDYFNLRRECEEKDSTIKELTAAIHASGVVNSKRITELEEIIRRKNMVINKMKKDMLVLEQQVIQLTRLRRKSSPTLSNSIDTQLPFMSSNILYDMSSTSPSSSDSDSPSGNAHQRSDIEGKRTQSQPSMKMNSFRKSIDKPRKQQCSSPLKENHMNQRTESNETSRPRPLGPSSGDFKRIHRRAQPESRTLISQRKWV